MKCTNCGNAISSDSHYCVYCGEPVLPNKSKSNWLRFTFFMCLGIAVTIMTVVLLYIDNVSQPSGDMVKNESNQMNSEEYKESLDEIGENNIAEEKVDNIDYNRDSENISAIDAYCDEDLRDNCKAYCDFMSSESLKWSFSGNLDQLAEIAKDDVEFAVVNMENGRYNLLLLRNISEPFCSVWKCYEGNVIPLLFCNTIKYCPDSGYISDGNLFYKLNKDGDELYTVSKDDTIGTLFYTPDYSFCDECLFFDGKLFVRHEEYEGDEIFNGYSVDKYAVFYDEDEDGFYDSAGDTLLFDWEHDGTMYIYGAETEGKYEIDDDGKHLRIYEDVNSENGYIFDFERTYIITKGELEWGLRLLLE